jgi:hypothetical protein
MKLPRFSLRMLFIGMTLLALVAAGLAWRQSTLAWIEDRHRAIDPQTAWRDYGMRVLALDPKKRNLSLSLRIWGETQCVYCFQSYSDAVHRTDGLAEFRRLFPEAKIEAKTTDDWIKLTQENGGSLPEVRAPPE